MRRGIVMTVALIALSAEPALAGVVVTSTDTKLDTKQASPSVVYADTDKLKVVNGATTVIYRGDLKKFWIISPARKSYTEMTPETMQQLSSRMAGLNAQMSAAQARMQEQMAKMPPAQRAQMEAMMAGRGGIGGAAAKPAEVTFTKAGTSKTVANIRCDVYKRATNGAQDEEICIAPIGQAGLTAADFRVLESMSEFVAPIRSAPQAPNDDFMSWGTMNKAIGFQGMPLDTIRYEGRAPSSQQTVQKIERTNIPASTFELPQGYTMQAIPTGPGPK